MVLPALSVPLHAPFPSSGLRVVVNTSNPDKKREFERLFSDRGVRVEFTGEDLTEIDADHENVVRHKASLFHAPDRVVIVEDTRLDVEGEDVGINVRWKLDQLTRMAGRRAHWVSLIAYREGDHVAVAEGSVYGIITEPRGPSGFGFDPLFLPDGRTKTLGEDKPDDVNARALAVQSLIAGAVTLYPPLEDWEGKWQEHK